MIRKMFLISLTILMLVNFTNCKSISEIKEKARIQREEEAKRQADEYKLLGAYIEIRNITNNFGGILRQEEYLHYAFITSAGEVLFKEKEILTNYCGVNYEMEFRLGDENKILQKTINDKTILTFIMTEDMYKDVFKEQ